MRMRGVHRQKTTWEFFVFVVSMRELLSHGAAAAETEFFSNLVTDLDGESAERLTDENIHDAVALWLDNETTARQKYGHISDWDTSECTDFSWLFHNAHGFDEDLGSWNTANVDNMQHMFQGAISFQGVNLHQWDVSRVSTMNDMFHEAQLLSTPSLADWDTSSVLTMAGMFQGAFAFNGDVSAWNVENVRDFSRMFEGAKSFDGDLGEWKLSSAVDFQYMFSFATSFSGKGLENWDTANVATMAGTFQNAVAFQADLSLWNTGNVRYMSEMFENAHLFDQDLSAWDTSRVSSFFEMFKHATVFDQDLNDWNVEKAIDMTRMFFDTPAFSYFLGWEALPPNAILAAMFCGSSGGFDPEFRNAKQYLWSVSCPNDGVEFPEEPESDPDERGGVGAVGGDRYPDVQKPNVEPEPDEPEPDEPEPEPESETEPDINLAISEITSGSRQPFLWMHSSILLAVLTAWIQN